MRAIQHDQFGPPSVPSLRVPEAGRATRAHAAREAREARRTVGKVVLEVTW